MEKKPFNVDIEALWQKRIGEHLSESIHYWRLMGSSGLLFTVVVLFILGLMYYEAFMDLIPDWVPIPFFFSIILAGVITRTSYRTLIQEADLLFLTPIESKMETYFQKAGQYNLAIQVLIIIVVLIVLTPIYTHKIPMADQQLYLYFIIPILLKGWNLQSNWTAKRVQDQRKVIYHSLARYLFNFTLLYLFFTGGKLGQESIWSIAIPILAIGLVLFFMVELHWKERHALHWLYLLEMENSLKNRFYQFVNAFADVPKLQSKVKKRAWLSFVTTWLPFHVSQSYKYLYLKTFIRGNEYFGIYVRLTVLGMLIVYFIPDIYARGIAYILFLFITSSQIRPIWGHHTRQFWISLYPLPKHLQRDSFIWMISILLAVQAVVMLIPSLFQLEDITVNGSLLGLGIVFAYMYPYALLKRRLSI